MIQIIDSKGAGARWFGPAADEQGVLRLTQFEFHLSGRGFPPKRTVYEFRLTETRDDGARPKTDPADAAPADQTPPGGGSGGGEDAAPQAEASPPLDDGALAPSADEQARRALGLPSHELLWKWLIFEGSPPTQNRIAVAALCWAAKDQLRDKPFRPWLDGEPIQVAWPLDNRFPSCAALALCGVPPLRGHRQTFAARVA